MGCVISTFTQCTDHCPQSSRLAAVINTHSFVEDVRLDLIEGFEVCQTTCCMDDIDVTDEFLYKLDVLAHLIGNAFQDTPCKIPARMLQSGIEEHPG